MLIAGFGMIAAGVGTVLYRAEVAAKNRKNIEAGIVERLFPGFGAGSTPERMIPVGVLLVIAGITVIVKSFSV